MLPMRFNATFYISSVRMRTHQCSPTLQNPQHDTKEVRQRFGWLLREMNGMR